MSELPVGWELVEIRDVVRSFKTIDPHKSPADIFNYVDIGSIDNQKQIINNPKTFFGKNAPSRARRLISSGDTLFSTVRTYLRNIALVPANLDGALTSTGICILRPCKLIHPLYLFHWARADEFVNSMSKSMDGTMYPAVTDGDVYSGYIPLPPLPEQHRIVAKLDSLFARSRRAREELEQVPGLCDRYKQAVLAAACSGRLTADWREQNPDVEPASELLKRIYDKRLRRYKEFAEKTTDQEQKKPSIPKSLRLISDSSFDIPVSWALTHPENITSFDNYSIGIGPFGSNLKVSDYTNNGVPLVFVRHIRTGDFSGQDPKYISLEKANELRLYTVEPLDLLITKMGEPPGDCEIYPSDRPLGVITSDCLKLRVWKDDLVREYFKNCINSPVIKAQLDLITRGVAQQKISVERFKSVIFPVPP
jgi:type I restriction enzyme, S subunit